VDSRLLKTLNAQASSTRDPVVWARAVCRAASHFARHGQTKDALTSIGVVRAQFGNELHHEVASWLMLAEGVLHFFHMETYEAYDRIRRAYGLAIALKTQSAIPTCAAWMAHIEFNAGAYEKMAAHLVEALTLAPENDHQARARASLVLADAYHLTDQYVLARPWYERARLNAAGEGDEATLSAMLYNVAAFRAANVRLVDTFGGENAKEAHRASMETSSSINFDFAIGTEGLGFLSYILRGLILTIDKQYAEALKAFDSIAEHRLPTRTLAPIFADRAWCYANLDQNDSAWKWALRAIDEVSKLTEADDIAYVESRVAQVADRLQFHAIAESHRANAVRFLEEHRAFQANLLEMLQKLPIG